MASNPPLGGDGARSHASRQTRPQPALARARGLVLAVAVTIAGGLGCSGGGAGGGTGGVPASGGRAATGGAAPSGSGGQSATGGTSATGGANATGGSSAIGGANATGGSSATGGAPATSGGRGGDTGSAGSAGGRGGAGTASGGRGGSAAGGFGGEIAFQACPATGDCAVLPLGDSITDGFGTPGGYRIELFRFALMNSKHLTFVGRNMNGPENVTVGATTTPFPKRHEGYSGYTIDPSSRSGISPLVDAALSAAKPNIILLMIGTNDIDLSVDVATAPMRLGNLLDRIITDTPNALLVVAKLTPLNYDAGNERVRAYNDAMPALIASRSAAGKHITLVDMYAPFVANPNFKTALLADQWHPNPAGYLIMAQTWYDAIKVYLR